MQSTPIIQLVQATEVAGLGTYPTHELEPNLFLLPLGYGQQQSKFFKKNNSTIGHSR
jgi:hypothetical protein